MDAARKHNWKVSVCVCVCLTHNHKHGISTVHLTLRKDTRREHIHIHVFLVSFKTFLSSSSLIFARDLIAWKVIIIIVTIIRSIWSDMQDARRSKVRRRERSHNTNHISKTQKNKREGVLFNANTGNVMWVLVKASFVLYCTT